MLRKLSLWAIALIVLCGYALSHAPPIYAAGGDDPGVSQMAATYAMDDNTIAPDGLYASAGGEVVLLPASDQSSFNQVQIDFALTPWVQVESVLTSRPEQPGTQSIIVSHYGTTVPEVTARSGPDATAQYIIWDRLPDAGDETQMDCSYQIDVQEEVSLRLGDFRGPAALQIDVKTLHGSSTLG
ncbi:MAG: hypothetical protein H6760_03540 [Candidatus Nomurabacteria bacterium]|nr:MAG: hypothetical protein H6760_03540 [Candidatus Nomurabacteria bacterium]